MADKFELTRRAFIAASTTTAVGLAGGRAFGEEGPNTAEVVPGKKSPNEKLNVAGIGVGGKGMGDISSCKRENIVALCDVDWERGGEAFYRMPEAKKFKDYREMFAEMGDGIDAVTISTPDHTHAPAAYLAMTKGKHVYVQKPLTHTVAEARFLTKVAAETGVTCQMGNQGHCGDGVRDLCEMIWSGAIGQVKQAHIWTNRPVWPQGIAEPLPEKPVPDTMAWDLWLGTAPVRPYNPGYAPFNWRGWWDFGCGAIGDMACHIMDPAFWSLKLYDAPTYTVEVVQQEGMTAQTPPLKSVIKFTVPARGEMEAVEVYWHDGGLTPERPEGIPADETLGDEGKNGSLYIGTEGFATAGEYGGKARLLPAAKMKDFKKPEETIPRVPGENPYRDWLDAIKAGKKSTSDFSYAGPLTEMANFGNVALAASMREGATGAMLEFDREAFKITNDADANRFLTKQYREGWELPLEKYVTVSS